jgi:hypothetical protein
MDRLSEIGGGLGSIPRIDPSRIMANIARSSEGIEPAGKGDYAKIMKDALAAMPGITGTHQVDTVNMTVLDNGKIHGIVV